MDVDIKKWLTDLYHATFSWENPQAWIWYLAAIGVVLVLIMMWRLKRASRNFRVFRDESGVAETTNNALRDLVRIACDGVETASRPKIQFRKRHGRINVEIRAKLYQGQRLSEVRDHMRRRVTKIFQETHGILVGDVSFTATGFKKSNQTPAIKDELQSIDEPIAAEPVQEPVAKAEPKVEDKPKDQPEAEEKKSSGFKTYSRSQTQATETKPAKEEPKKDEPKSEPHKEGSDKKKGGLFGGFGSKKSDPEIVEDTSKQSSEELLEDDDFSALLAENDEKPEDKK